MTMERSDTELMGCLVPFAYHCEYGTWIDPVTERTAMAYIDRDPNLRECVDALRLIARFRHAVIFTEADKSSLIAGLERHPVLVQMIRIQAEEEGNSLNPERN